MTAVSNDEAHLRDITHQRGWSSFTCFILACAFKLFAAYARFAQADISKPALLACGTRALFSACILRVCDVRVRAAMIACSQRAMAGAAISRGCARSARSSGGGVLFKGRSIVEG